MRNLILYRMVLFSNLVTSSSELFFPGQTLALGKYQIQLTVTRNDGSSQMKSAFVQINPSGITANLVLFGTSMINVGVEEDLQLDPGNYSLDGDGKSFNASAQCFSFRYDSMSLLLGLYI